MDTVTTLTTVDSNSPSTTEGELPAVAYIGLGVALVSMGRVMLERGVKQAGGWQGVRKMLHRANDLIPQLEVGEDVSSPLER